MYEELVKKLRYESTWRDDYPEDKDMLLQAADAIEQLQKSICPHYIRNVHDRGDDSLCDKYKCEVNALPKWIPVSERVPFAESGDVSEKVLVTDGQYMAIAEWFNFEMCEPFWSYTGIGDITHWMPLPEPPKEDAE